VKKIAFVFFFLLSVWGLLNFGKWMDVTQKPVKSDMVVCLGGGTVERVKRSVALLEEGYASKSRFLLLGESWYNQPYLSKKYPNLSVLIDETPKNTKEEILYLKKYMVVHGYRSALIVTDPPHSRRVEILLSLLHVPGDEKMSFRIVSSEQPWWNAERYYENAHARKAVMHESVKILGSYLLYGWY
jgi:alcohol dehydrogenase class IV